MIRRLALLAILLPGFALSWELVDASKRVGPSKGDFSLQLPDDWLCDTSRHSLEASHDGPGLNHVSIAIPSHKAVFKNSKKVSTPASTPEDLAEDYIAEVQTGPTAVRSLEVLSNEPTELAGKPAFRVHLRYRAADTAGGAAMESVAIGTALKDGVLLARFEAPSIHYFERWVNQFDAAAKTLTLTPAPK
jgi:hypothetical protein